MNQTILDDHDAQVGHDTPLAAPAAVTATALLLAGCGGGSGGDSSPVTPVTPVTSTPSDQQTSRFLAQASLAAPAGELAQVKSTGLSAWIESQFAAPSAQSHWDWLVANGYADVANRNNQAGFNNTAWRKLIGSPDPLRQRMVLALSEIFVISINGLTGAWRQFVAAAYLDMLETNAFGNFRSLLEAVTLSIGMGSYLNMRGNQRENPATGRVPDENYAREILQLFTIGLHELNADGTERRDAGGQPIETYTQATITGLARVFTGWDYATSGPALTDAPDRVRLPMQHIAARFSTGDKTFLGTTVPASADGPTALRLALDTIFNHPNVGPFIGKQLIQRLVTSNPSPAYVGRVAAAFNNSGGVRGDMKAVIRAVLLDPEVRTDSPNPSPAWGRVREPMLRFIQWARTWQARSPSNQWNIGDTSDPATRLGQSPLRAPSVFNFFRPGYVPPNTALGAAGLVAPELQITNESSVVGYVNYLQTAVANGLADLKADYSAEIAIATDADALVERVALLLAAGQLAPATLATIKSAVATIAATTDAGKANRVYAAILLALASPEYLVAK